MTTDAALKAWETRRLNGWTPKSTQAAKPVEPDARLSPAQKAWITRRANAKTAAKAARSAKKRG
jgi:hypothetical protein